MHKQCKGKAVLSVLLSVVMVVSLITVGTVSMSAETSTGIGLCAYALNAYNEGWPYVWGGMSYGAVDCSGLIKSYNGVGGIRTDMVTSSQNAGLDWGYVDNGIPNVHGLGLHKPGHVGIYVGSGNAIDARGTNWGIIYGSVYSVNWVEWYKLVDVSYPESGWVKFDGESFYYENGEYVDNTSRTIDGVTYYFDSLGRSDKEPSESAYLVTDYSGSSSQSGSAEITSNSSTFLKIGSQGDKVIEVQEKLKNLGYFEDDVTGYFGTYTAACVKEFQTDADIEVDGIVGPEFMNAINSENAPSKAGANTSDDEDDEEEATEAPTAAPTEASTEAPTPAATEEVTEAEEAEVEEVTEAEETEETEETEDTADDEEVTAETEETEEEAEIEEATDAPTTAPTEAPTEKATKAKAVAENKSSKNKTVAKAAPTEAPTEAPTLPPTPLEDGVITYGEYDVENSSEIAEMQNRLAELGYYTAQATGVFDDNTLAALHSYFSKSELRAEDFITREQYDVLMSDNAVANTVAGQYSDDEVSKVQSLLVKLGYLSKATGSYDDTTISAVKTAQANFDMEATGEVSDDFVKALELASARTDSQASAASGNVSSQNANASVTSGNTTAQTAAKTAPLTGYTFGEASAPASGDETTFILVAGMMFALALGTTIVYTKSRVSKKKEEK